MRKRFILSILLCVVLLLVPSSALAGEQGKGKPQPLSVSADAASLDIEVPGNVIPAGNSGRWVILERTITADLVGGINGTFTLVYHGNVESIETQAGTMEGVITITDATIPGVGQGIDISGVLRGRSEGIQFVGVTPEGWPLFNLSFGGTFTFQSGIQGTGDLAGSFTFVPTPEGHVAFLVGGTITLEGQWH